LDHTLASIGYQTHELAGIKNERIIEQVLQARENRVAQDPRHTEYEDSELPQTPEAIALVGQIDAAIRGVDARLERAGLWAHILSPGESTMYHTHGVANYPGIGLSWVYYASHPPGSGDLVFICQVNERRVYHRVEPRVGRLVIFSAAMPHMTTKHVGEGLRISISGNHYLPRDVGDEIQSGKDSSRISFFTG